MRDWRSSALDPKSKDVLPAPSNKLNYIAENVISADKISLLKSSCRFVDFFV